MRVTPRLSYSRKVEIIADKLEQLLDYSTDGHFNMALTREVVGHLQEEHGNFADFKTRKEVLDMLHDELLDDRATLYQLVALAVTSNLDPDLALNFGTLAADRVAATGGESEALEQVVAWLSRGISPADRSALMVTYERTRTYLENELEFDSIRNDWSIASTREFIQVVSDVFIALSDCE